MPIVALWYDRVSHIFIYLWQAIAMETSAVTNRFSIFRAVLFIRSPIGIYIPFSHLLHLIRSILFTPQVTNCHWGEKRTHGKFRLCCVHGPSKTSEFKEGTQNGKIQLLDYRLTIFLTLLGLMTTVHLNLVRLHHLKDKWRHLFHLPV